MTDADRQQVELIYAYLRTYRAEHPREVVPATIAFVEKRHARSKIKVPAGVWRLPWSEIQDVLRAA